MRTRLVSAAILLLVAVVPVVGVAPTSVSALGKLGLGERRCMPLGGDTGAALVNLTPVLADGPGHGALVPSSTSTAPAVSNVNFAPGTVDPNLAVASIGSDGAVCFLNSKLTRVHLVADHLGTIDADEYHPASSSGAARRVADTRTGLGGSRLSPSERRCFAVGGSPGDAALVNLTPVLASGAGDGRLVSSSSSRRPTASNVNFGPGTVDPNIAVAPIGTDGRVCFLNSAHSSVHLVADHLGSIDADAYVSASTTGDPVRRVDTRTGLGGAKLAPGDQRCFSVSGRPGDGAIVNLTPVLASAAGDGLLVSSSVSSVPAGTNVNFRPGSADPNVAIAPIGADGRVCFRNSAHASVHLVADHLGSIAADAYSPATSSGAPTRLLDTRRETPSTTPAPPKVVSGAQFAETFDGNTGLNSFDKGVWHRDPYLVDDEQWSGDHDLACGSPDTQRVIHRNRPAESFYVCRDHIMTSVGDTSGYSIGWFSPKKVFPSVRSVSFDVNLTDLGERQWWKVGVVSLSRYNSKVESCCGTAPGFLVSDVGAADLPTDLQNDEIFVATWGGGASAGYPAALMVGDRKTGATANPSPNDKATRHPVSLTDNRNGTVTFRVAGVSATASGSFPACPCRVVIYDHNYTPNKAGNVQGYTWHWDNVIVR